MIRRLPRLAATALSACVLAFFFPTSAAAQEIVEYYGVDALGSVRIVFDASGAVTGRMDYGPFGEQLSPSTVHKSYAGLFRDGEAGLDYAEARMYQPRTGRFNAPDSVYSGLFQPQAWNRYSYALNSPLTYTDPTGLQADPCLKSHKDIQEPASDDAGPIRVTVKCTSGDGGGGGGPTLSGDMWWFLNTWLDRFTLSETLGSRVPGEDEIVPTGRYTPSQTIQDVDKATLVVAVVAPVIAKAAGAAAVGEAAAARTAAGEVAAGTNVYRVFGGEARGMGQSFTNVKPWTVPNYRGAAGLPSGNSGSFLLEGFLNNAEGVVFRPSLPGAGGAGGLPELVIPNPSRQVTVIRVSGLNPRW